MGPKEPKFITMNLFICLHSNLPSGAARTRFGNPNNPAAVDSCGALHIIVRNYVHLETFRKGHLNAGSVRSYISYSKPSRTFHRCADIYCCNGEAGIDTEDSVLC